MPGKLESERQFLLKGNFRNLNTVDILTISQYYLEDGTRYRKQYGDVDPAPQYFKNVKTPVSPGVYREDEAAITQAEFDAIYPQFQTFVMKERSIVDAGNGLKWEVDVFESVRLVIAEIELPDIKMELEIPDWLKDDIILEVTGMKQFCNRSLSIPM